MNSLVLSKNKLFFGFLVVGYIFGVFLYDFLDLTFVDELMALFLVFFLGLAYVERRDCFMINHLLVLGGYFAFQIVYSFIIKSNVSQAILTDAIIQIKPFLGFYCTFILMPELTKSQKRILTFISLIGATLLLSIAISGAQFLIFGHPSRFATAATITAVLFLYCSSFSWEDCVVFIVILAIGIFSTRAKFYGFMVLAFFLSVAVKLGFRFRFNPISTIVLFAVILLTIGVGWEKIQLYFFEGTLRSKDMWARPVLYLTSFKILLDYLPFGSGFGSFATYASAAYYSNTYTEYGINTVWGLSKSYPSFIADTYYPALAETGFCGVILFLLFWGKIIGMAKDFFNKNSSQLKEMTLFVLIVLFFAIESTSDSTFTHNRGLFMTIMMGLVLANMKQTASEGETNQQDPIQQTV